MTWLGYGPPGLARQPRPGAGNTGDDISSASAMPAATGGTVTDITDPGDGLDYRVHTFTGDGTFEVTTGGDFEYLILGGGASGAANKNDRVGQPGGAAGTVRQGTVTLGTGTQSVTVGPGGVGVTDTVKVDTDGGTDGIAGGASSALGVTAPGGQATARNSEFNQVGVAGGSNADFAGGAGDYSIDNSGGGAGSGEAGYDATNAYSGDGGDGVTITIRGTSETYGGGGGGSPNTFRSPGAGGAGGGTDGVQPGASMDAAANTGSGSGGSTGSSTADGNSGDGASGIVIIRYRR